MSLWMRRFWCGLTRNEAVTAPDAWDPRLRGRTYAIPFDRVWRAATSLASGGLRGWSLVSADDFEGEIHAASRARLRDRYYDITIRITLDQDGQTRVDARASSRTGRVDFGANARRIGRFFTALDRALAQEPAQAGGWSGATSP
ncbi:MAG TPA: DUF1499 domain-containing protein [Longimicrobiales bacterium]|nr:DUF1499 domain-containing protein [Longimicrobiales bacterium]